jgi:uncharacterized protein (TIGR02246 family)
VKSTFLLGLLAFAVSACAGRPEAAVNQDKIAAEIRAVMEAQQAAWNRGDIDGFMEGYDRAETTTFVSGGELTRGWETVLARYKQRYSSREQMGTLAFSDLAVASLSPEVAVVDGRWQLTRTNDVPHGRFTLLFRRANNSWRIIHDTTTSATP